MITTQLKDGSGKGHKLKVYKEGEIGVVIHTHPPPNEDISTFPFRSYFTDKNGSNDMAVNGATSSTDFYIAADPEYDVYINSLSIKLAAAGATFAEFGNQAALTNGIEFVWSSTRSGEFVIHDGIKDNLEFYRLNNETPAITDLTGAGADAIIVFVSIENLFGVQWGIRLQPGTKDKLIFRVRDNISSVTEFNIIGYGFQLREKNGN